MIELDDLPFAPPDTTPVVPTPRKCTHPKRDRIKVHRVLDDDRNLFHVDQTHPYDTSGRCEPAGYCGRCNSLIDSARARAGRNSRARGGAAELQVARALGGRKMGPLNLPWDVEVAGYARIQVRKYATPESLRKVAAELARIGSGAEMPGYVWLEPGRGGEALIVFRLADFAERHGGAR